MIFTKEQLLKREFLEKVKKKAEDFLASDSFQEGYDLAKSLKLSIDKDNFKAELPELYKEYYLISIRLAWLGLNIMKEADVRDMFQYHFSKIFRIPDYDIWQKVRTILISIIILSDRDRFKKSLRDALLNNKEKLTFQKLKIGNEEKEPTVGNWLLDYTRNLGGGIADKLKFSQFLTNGANIRKLNHQERDRVRMLFELYERLKLSSQTLEGIEEDIPIDEEFGKGIISEGVPHFYKEDENSRAFENIADSVIRERDGGSPGTKLPSLKDLINSYPVGSLERKALEEELKRLGK